MPEDQTVDISKIKVGDSVTLGPLEVVSVGQKGLSLMVHDSDGTLAHFLRVQIAAHHPAPRALELGQQVLKMEDTYGAAVTGPWLVIGIHKERVWLGSPEGERERYAQVSRDELKHMDGTRVEA